MAATLWCRVPTGQAVVWIGPCYHLWADPSYVPVAYYDQGTASWLYGDEAEWGNSALPPAPPSPPASPCASSSAPVGPGSPWLSSSESAPSSPSISQSCPAEASPSTGSSSSGPSEIWGTPSQSRQPQDDSGVGLASPPFFTPSPGVPASTAARAMGPTTCKYPRAES
ncbi:uncharacterized protein LOC127751938 [Frankliniella occidentalis]|uniref:Uncharacterized protein LOC127751938 n=1 Tax=Frankliniella occidentalis TaxID=133901 RepID=A0A9C6XAU1_FRAOC|nr:uncharacterized protein LOC127751938 [Frankliniella occidentalis]